MSQPLTIAGTAHGHDWLGDNSDHQEPEPLTVEEVDLSVPGQWDDEVLSHRESNVFQLSCWARVLQKTYRHQPIYLRFRCGNQLAALLPIMEVNSPLTGKRGVCLPFADHCGPLMFDRDMEVFRLLEAVNRIGQERNWKYFELRSDELANEFSVPSEEYYGHELDLVPDTDQLFAVLPPSVRRAVRKAEKAGVEVEISNTEEAMSDFYKLHVRTRRRHGAPPQPRSFFQNIEREIISQGRGFIVLARANNRPVAAAVFFHSGREALYKFGASDPRAQSLRANNLVMWRAIAHLATLGFDRLRFGRTDLTDEGLRRFKTSWRAVENKIRYFRYEKLGRPANQPVRRRSARLSTHVFRKLPVVVNRAVGKLVYPHLD